MLQGNNEILSLDEKVRKCIWTNAIHFAKDRNTTDIKILGIKFAHRVYLAEVHAQSKYAQEIIKHFAYLALKEEEDIVRQTALEVMPAEPETYNVILSRVKDVSKVMRELAYKKMIDSKFKLEYIEKDKRYETIHALLNEVSPELKEEVDKVIKLVLFSQKIEGSEEEQNNISMMFLIDSFIDSTERIPIHEAAILVDLISLGLKKYYNVQLLVQTE